MPAADMRLDFVSMSETFYMTNMSPQHLAFNRGAWRSLEHGIRKMVIEHGPAFVVTAPLLEPHLKRLKSHVAVPEFFYKIAYFPEAEFMVAFLMPNTNSKGLSYHEKSVSVDELEELTGIDFFADLPDKLESRLEEKVY